MMKVLMFGWEFPPHISGGLGTACYGLTKSLSGFNDVELKFVVPRKFGDEDQSGITLLGAGEIPVIEKQLHFEDSESKIRYYELNSELIPYLGTSEYDELKSKITSEEKHFVEITPEGNFIFSGDYGINLFREIQNYAYVAEILARKLDFDVIHVHDWMTIPAGMAAQRISGKPLVVHIHSTEFDRSGQHVSPGICKIEKEGVTAANVVVAVSQLTRNILIRNYHTDPQNVITVYNAVEPLSSVILSQQKPAASKKTVTFLGRITRQKGPEYFLETAFRVLQKTNQVRFIMAGKGDLRDAMIKRAAELNISDHIDFPGFVPDKDVPQLLADSDIFVMPSVSEPFGLVALEAMQAGIPAIISKQSGVAEILKSAICLDYWDVQGMTVAMLDLLNNPYRSSRLGMLGKKEVAGYLWKNSAEQIRQAYISLTTGSQIL
jgi:glycosyltransferase involved in cell wall biosynthesis